MTVNKEQPVPTGSGEEVWPLVIADMHDRDRIGRQRYGTPLRLHNGRNAILDSYQEALDLVVYLRQAYSEDNDRRARLSIKFSEMTRDGQGLSRYQEDQILAALGYERSV